MSGREGPVEKWVRTKASELPPPPTERPPEPASTDGIPKVGDQILAGKFEVERVIGIGGMGVVVSALHKRLGGRVAFKFLLPSMRNEEFTDRFLREGQAAVKIQSEHIARVLDVGVLDDGTPYLMMEHLTGADLAEYLEQQGPLPIEDAVDLVIQACDALASAHAANIVHRDLKPSNLFITQRADGSPLVKVLDFGISKLGQVAISDIQTKTNLTRPGMILGSPMYMSPEQLENARNVDPRSDIWAMGTVLWELVVGRSMWDAESFVRLASMIVHDPAPPLREALPDAPPELEEIILRCVEKDPSHRYQNVAELASDLAPLTHPDARVLASRIAKAARPSTESNRERMMGSGRASSPRAAPSGAGRRTPVSASASKGERESARILVGAADSGPLDRTTPLEASSTPPGNPSASGSAAAPANLVISTHRDPPPTPSKRALAVLVAVIGCVAVAGLGFGLTRMNAKRTDIAPSEAPSAISGPTPASVSVVPADSSTPATPTPDETASAEPATSASAARRPPETPRKPGRARPASAGASSASAKPATAAEGDLLLDRH